jgi:6-phosphogluconolactonase/glucosamine-6-phosphate isomerase/deaminase
MHRLVVTSKEGVTRAIARGLDRALEHNMKVLWLLSGGSNIAIELDVLNRLAHATPQNLTVSLIDERFVALDSPDSNWHQLIQGGLRGERARLEPPIIDTNLGLIDAADDFAGRLAKCLDRADIVIGQCGIGADGHTAGILPHTEGVHEKTKLVIGYEGTDFKRLTTTSALFAQLDLAAIVAFGADKRPVIERLKTPALADDQPVTLLLEAKEVVIYTDQKIDWPDSNQ